MKISSIHLKKIIKEEIKRALSEEQGGPTGKDLPVLDDQTSYLSGIKTDVEKRMQEIHLVLNGEGPFSIRGYLNLVSKSKDQTKASMATSINKKIDDFWNQFLALSISNFFRTREPYVKDPRLSQEKPMQPGQTY